MNASVDYGEIVRPGHLNPEYTRYERHRVWVVEANLKESERHIYHKRTFYIDEDSWQIALVDQYDERGELWRFSEGHALQFTNANLLWYASLTYHDLFSGRYLVELNGQEDDAFVFGKKLSRRQFTKSAIRRQGIQ